jgi:predicted ABC-type exoprotein transport system permease subunit
MNYNNNAENQLMQEENQKAVKECSGFMNYVKNHKLLVVIIIIIIILLIWWFFMRKKNTGVVENISVPANSRVSVSRMQ